MKISAAVSRVLEQNTENAPRIVVLDIETTPALSYHWRYWKENISPTQGVKSSELLSIAAKVLGERGMFFASRQDDKDDRALAAISWSLVDRADVVIAHNGRAFDMKTLNARWAFWQLPPPGPYKVVDTCLIARKEFNFPSNSLNGLAKYLGIGAKASHEGFDLWRKCMEGDKAAWATMEKYNIRDVELLEKVYLRLRAYDRQHPNMGIYHNDDVMRCVCCGSENISTDYQKLHYLMSAGYEVYRCKDCGKLTRDNKPCRIAKASGRNV